MYMYTTAVHIAVHVDVYRRHAVNDIYVPPCGFPRIGAKYKSFDYTLSLQSAYRNSAPLASAYQL